MNTNFMQNGEKTKLIILSINIKIRERKIFFSEYRYYIKELIFDRPQGKRFTTASLTLVFRTQQWGIFQSNFESQRMFTFVFSRGALLWSFVRVKLYDFLEPPVPGLTLVCYRICPFVKINIALLFMTDYCLPK